MVQDYLNDPRIINDPDWEPIIEAASPEEAALIDERMKDYERDTSSFVPLDKII